MSARWPVLVWLLLIPACFAASPSCRYQNARYGFQLNLPSSAWKPVAFQGGVAAFGVHHPDRQVGIQVRDEPLEHYQITVKRFHRLIGTLPNLLQKPRIQQGTTSKGNPYAFIEVIEMSDTEVPMVVAISHVYLSQRHATVVTTFQGRLSVHANQMNRGEINQEEREARSICLSVDGLKDSGRTAGL